MKPRIRYREYYFFPLGTVEKAWFCETRCHLGTGGTPKEAYESWVKDKKSCGWFESIFRFVFY